MPNHPHRTRVPLGPGAREHTGCFDECFSVESLADRLDEAASRSVDEDLARRLQWRARLMRELVTRRTTPPPPPDYPTTIEVLDYCQRWIAEHAPELIPRSTSMRTQATGWLYFTSPKALVCKLSHGRVDLYVGQLGFNGTVDDLVALTGSPAAAPAGFAAAVDTKGNPVLRRETGHRVTPADGLPNDTADIDVALQACADAARWLGTGPALLETSAE